MCNPVRIAALLTALAALPAAATPPSASLRPEPRPSAPVPTVATMTGAVDVTNLAVNRSMRPIARNSAGGLPATAVTAETETGTEALDVAAMAAAALDEVGFRDWRTGFEARARAAGISQATLDAAFAGVGPDAEIIRLDQNQAEFSRALWDYLDSAVSQNRIDNGTAALARHAEDLRAIERRYGVEAEVVVAVWGLESAYGAVRGSTDIITAMATLAHEGRRQDFFETQLIAALQILEAGDIGPRQMTGSWAGAMGHTQFMPTSYLEFAVDGDGDGRRDIWSDNPVDALASTANYLSEFGWTTGQPWGMEVRLPEGFDYSQTGERIKRSIDHWNREGVRLPGGARLPDHGRASILLPAGADGVAFVIFDNFHMIERYNPADAYVIAVGHLSDRITGGGAFRADWPRGDRALTRDERVELQERLTRAGFSTLGIDGIIGPNTLEAVRRYQASQGLTPDGYASLRILERLRRG